MTLLSGGAVGPFPHFLHSSSTSSVHSQSGAKPSHASAGMKGGEGIPGKSAGPAFILVGWSWGEFRP